MTLDSAMLACAIFAETTLLAVLARRRVGRWLPWFCGYIAWCLVSDIAGWAATSSSPAFCGQFYFFEAIIDSVLQFAVLLELAWSLLRSFHSTLDRRNVWLVGASLFLAGVMLWSWAAIGVPEYFSGQARVLLYLQFSMSLLRIVFLVTIAAVSQFLAIGWRNRELFVAAGLGFYSICSFTVTLIHSHASPYSPLLDRALTAAYLGVLLYWIMQFWKEPARRAAL